jgi:myosin heavy chain 6/7
VFFRAGTLGFLEELRDEKVSKILTWMQAQIRTFLTKKQYAALKEQRVGLQVIQRTLRQYMQNKKWPWFNLMQRVIPLCAGNKEAKELKVSTFIVPSLKV